MVLVQPEGRRLHLVTPLRGAGRGDERDVGDSRIPDKYTAYQAVIAAACAYADARYSHPESWGDENGASPVAFKDFLAALNELRNAYEGGTL
jgi:hypothetical protein